MSSPQPDTYRTHFDETHTLHVLTHYLPAQGPLKDFVHHNPLHAFEDMKFYAAIFHVSHVFGYRVTFTLTEYRNLYKMGRIAPEVLKRVISDRYGVRAYTKWRDKLLHKSYDWSIEPRVGKLRNEWKRFYDIDLDNAVQPLLFRIICSYLDQGIAVTPFPYEDKGLLHAIRKLDKQSVVSFFKTDRARKLLSDTTITITDLLTLLVGNESYFAQYLYDQQFAHPGWSGMVSTVEQRPETLLYAKKITLKEMILLELLFEVDALSYRFGASWKPIGTITENMPDDVFRETKQTDLTEVLSVWHDAFEWSYYDTALRGLSTVLDTEKLNSSPSYKHFQAIYCIDEREYSLRTYMEQVEPDCETYGAPGYFGVAFYFQPAHARFYDKLAPASATPMHLIREKVSDHPHTPGKEVMFTKESHTLVRGYIFSYLLGLPALGKLFMNLFFPSMSPAIADSFAHMNAAADLTILATGQRDSEHNLQVGFTPVEMADRVEAILRGIGLTGDFAPLVYIVGHGSSSANNPHHGAHDCGACSGRPGLVNARVFAWMANYSPVRDILKSRKLLIPEETQFLAAHHDTASDEMRFYDEDVLTKQNALRHRNNIPKFEKSLDYNAKERSRRFVSINTKADHKTIRADIKKRAVSYFEPRPELGHGTNAICVVGRRSLTERLFLDRRAFLQSYDYRQDDDGSTLLNVITPLPAVCGGINLEYYFSRMDNSTVGAGTKLPHNVMGLIGVANSSDGDLRLGLPLQMIEVHDPVRLLMVVEHRTEVILSVIMNNPALSHWFTNDWIHLIAADPEKKKLFRFRNGAFVPYVPLIKHVQETENISDIVEESTLMETNHILHATGEHIPVHILKK